MWGRCAPSPHSSSTATHSPSTTRPSSPALRASSTADASRSRSRGSVMVTKGPWHAPCCTADPVLTIASAPPAPGAAGGGGGVGGGGGEVDYKWPSAEASSLAFTSGEKITLFGGSPLLLTKTRSAAIENAIAAAYGR